jgi:hypothetical protein
MTPLIPQKISLNLLENFSNFKVAHPHPFTRGNHHSITHQIGAINSSGGLQHLACLNFFSSTLKVSSFLLG